MDLTKYPVFHLTLWDFLEPVGGASHGLLVDIIKNTALVFSPAFATFQRRGVLSFHAVLQFYLLSLFLQLLSFLSSDSLHTDCASSCRYRRLQRDRNRA